MKKHGKETLASLKEEVEILKEEIKHLKSKLSMSSSAFLNIVGKSLDGVIILDQKKMVVYTNYAAIKLFDRNIADLLGEPLALDFNPIQFEEMTEIHIPRADGSAAIVEASVLRTEWNSEPCYVVSFRDITERKKADEMLEHISTHDYLTNLPNRVYFEKQIDSAIQSAKDNDQYMALIYIDLDNFKTVNDTLGHAVGDLLLQEVSTTLQQNVRRADTVARLGGDEFAVILTALRKPERSGMVARMLLDKLGKVFVLDGHEVYVNASIGIAVYPHGGINAIELIKNADLAMYIAKSHGKNQYRYFSEELNQQSEQNLLVINGLRHVIRNKELFLQYQPIIDLNTSNCCGFEALIRWQHPLLGLIYPEQFLPFAEEIGAMLPIGRWVIQRALDDYKKCKLESFLFLSVNMSANEFLAPEAEDSIISYMQEREIPIKNLVVELTETAIIRDPEITIKKFKRLADVGVQIAIDDYGIGYSSLSLLKRLPISIVKIDKTFISDIETDQNDMIIVKSTIQLAHNLGLKVVAEGVETKEQLAFLKEHKCDYVQGYYFAKPLNLDQLTAYIQELNG